MTLEASVNISDYCDSVESQKFADCAVDISSAECTEYGCAGYLATTTLGGRNCGL